VLFPVATNDREVNVPEETEAKQVEPVAKPPSQVGKIILIVVLSLVSSVGGGAVTWYLASKTLAPQAVADPEAETAAEEAEVVDPKEQIAELMEKGAALPLEPFVVNLADSEAPRYLRIQISLMLDDKTRLGEIAENAALQLKLRDVILQQLTQKSSHELINEEGKIKLRQELQEKVDPYFIEPKLVDVMFTEFVIQL
jgi:flagellar FliL protein